MNWFHASLLYQSELGWHGSARHNVSMLWSCLHCHANHAKLCWYRAGTVSSGSVNAAYATQYPEAVPLRNITASRVAEALIDIFARHGIHEEILTDQGKNFTSALLGELYRIIGTRSLRTSPYHPQTDGLVERFNWTFVKESAEGRKEKLVSHATICFICLP